MRFVFFVIAAIAFIEQHNLLHIISADSFELCGSRDGGDSLFSSEVGNSSSSDYHDERHFYCPSRNSCCRMGLDDRNRYGWGCIASDMGSRNATCCMDDDNSKIISNTGCPAGYKCRRRHRYDDKDDDSDNDADKTSSFSYDCFLPKKEDGNNNDPLMQVLPRYRLCRAEENNRKLYGLTVRRSSGANDDVSYLPPESLSDFPSSSSSSADIAYYSNLGPIGDDKNNSLLSNVEMALIVVHGATRNGDDYFCSAKATIELQTKFVSKNKNKNKVLVIAPDFLRGLGQNPSPSFLYWNDEKDKDGSWRYGADASGPVLGISSFDALDAIMTALKTTSIIPNLRRIVVAGHSSGGQFVHRWSILTPSTVWPLSSLSPSSTETKSESLITNSLITIHAIVANPSSYVYFTPLRFLDSNTDNDMSENHDIDEPMYSWKTPSVDNDYGCPSYNLWGWGLEDGGKRDVPYRKRAFSRVNNDKSIIVERYLRHRSVLYLIGNLDRCSDGSKSKSGGDINGKKDRCRSHGLGTTCADDLQGRNRYERNARYVASLRLYSSISKDNENKGYRLPRHKNVSSKGIITKNTDTTIRKQLHRHHRVVVPNVGHDHSMMFQSKEGIRAIYYFVDGNDYEDDYDDGFETTKLEM